MKEEDNNPSSFHLFYILLEATSNSCYVLLQGASNVGYEHIQIQIVYAQYGALHTIGRLSYLADFNHFIWKQILITKVELKPSQPPS